VDHPSATFGTVCGASTLAGEGTQPWSEEVCVPQLDISLASVELVAEPLPPLRVVHSQESGASTDWDAVVASAEEPCLLLDAHGLIGAVSGAFLALFGLGRPDDVLGRGLLDDLLDLRDFSSDPGRLSAAELERIPPLQSLRSAGLSRGLIRAKVRGVTRTVDAVTTPILSGGEVSGSLTFFVTV
jgi:PAS domain-containing protein